MPEKNSSARSRYCVATEACQNRYLLLCSPSLSPHMMDSAIQWPWKALMVVLILMHWIVFHDPVDRAIQLLNNLGLGSNRTELTLPHAHCRNENDKIVQRTKPA